MIQFYEMRQAVELNLLDSLPLRILLVEHESWQQDQARIAAFLEESFPV